MVKYGNNLISLFSIDNKDQYLLQKYSDEGLTGN